MLKILIVAGILTRALSQETTFRFDYEFSSQANGWLKFHPIPGTWAEARRRCYAEGAVLASPLTKQLKAAMISFVLKQKNSVPTAIFTGVHASFSRGDYTSVEGVHWLRMPIAWASGEPDNYDNAESCLAMLTDNKGSMSDVKCEDVLPYVCYKPYTHLTMTECGTTDPAYILDVRTGSCYKFHARGLRWHSAYLTCIAEGGYLVVISSREEMNVVREIYERYPNQQIFGWPHHMAVGFHDWGDRVSFLTIHGDKIDGELKWDTSEPNNSTKPRSLDEGEFCGSVSRKALLNDLWCGVPVPFLCEKKPNSLLPI